MVRLAVATTAVMSLMAGATIIPVAPRLGVKLSCCPVLDTLEQCGPQTAGQRDVRRSVLSSLQQPRD